VYNNTGFAVNDAVVSISYSPHAQGVADGVGVGVGDV
jgi:hypothetical protein